MNVELIKGSQLKILLKRKGIKLKDIVEKFDMNRIMVSRYLNDNAAMPASFVLKVALYANLNVNDLLEGNIEPNTIDITYTDVAAEPQVQYVTAPKVPELPESKEDHKEYIKDLVTIDVTGLTEIIVDLRKQIDNVEQTVMDLKEGKFTVNQ